MPNDYADVQRLSVFPEVSQSSERQPARPRRQPACQQCRQSRHTDWARIYWTGGRLLSLRFGALTWPDSSFVEHLELRQASEECLSEAYVSLSALTFGAFGCPNVVAQSACTTQTTPTHLHHTFSIRKHSDKKAGADSGVS